MPPAPFAARAVAYILVSIPIYVVLDWVWGMLICHPLFTLDAALHSAFVGALSGLIFAWLDSTRHRR
jgi:hypothetical protein